MGDDSIDKVISHIDMGYLVTLRGKECAAWRLSSLEAEATTTTKMTSSNSFGLCVGPAPWRTTLATSSAAFQTLM
jgi:hypothetical protein